MDERDAESGEGLSTPASRRAGGVGAALISIAGGDNPSAFARSVRRTAVALAEAG